MRNGMRIALATCARIPEPDPDQDLLLEALAARGLEPFLAAWDDPALDLAGARMCVLRSTWNYYRAVDAFLAWIDRTAAQTALWNPAPVVRWNAHKRYLADLAARGVPVVPTRFLRSGSELRETMRDLGADTVVIKPAVSAASFETIKVGLDDLGRGARHVDEVAARCEVMVQPYVRSVEGWGERSLMWIDGALTHSIRKSPRFGGEHETVSEAQAIEADERALAERALATVEEPLLYARIDMARDQHGAPMIMELELIEPSLFLAQSPPALARLADAIAARA
ncbi:MAG: hypothetical protein HYV09_14990 [Deltaproteobacteria bacterium]|nr:hypothetical protein [Deltaproteobacteria bacterium]